MSAGADTPRWAKWTLLAIVLVGFGLRVCTILWGVPISPYVGRYNADEYASYVHALNFPAQYLGNNNYVYGSTLGYLVGALLLPFEKLVSHTTYELMCNMGMRSLAVLAGTASIWMTYRLALRLYGVRTALVAAAMLAVSFTHCVNSSFSQLDVPISFLLVAGFTVLARLVDTVRLRDVLLLGVIAGTLVGAKITMAIFVAIPPLAMVVAYAARGDRPQVGRALLQAIPLASLFMLVAFGVYALSNFHALAHADKFLAYFREQKHLWYDRTVVPWTEVPSLWWLQSWVALGSKLVPIMALAGVAVMGRRNLPIKIALVAFVLLHILALRHYVFPRSVAQIAPILCLYAARSAGFLLELRPRPARVAGLALAAAAVVLPLRHVVDGIRLRLADPRTEAARWLDRTIPPGSTVGVFDIYPESAWEHPALVRPRYRVVPYAQRPDYLVISSFTFAAMTRALASTHLRGGYVWDPAHAADWYNYRIPRPEVFRFFDELARGIDYGLILKLDPPEVAPESAVDFAGVGISIYLRKTP